MRGSLRYTRPPSHRLRAFREFQAVEIDQSDRYGGAFAVFANDPDLGGGAGDAAGRKAGMIAIATGAHRGFLAIFDDFRRFSREFDAP